MQKQALVVDDSRVARLTLNKLLSLQQFDVMIESVDGLTATKQLRVSEKFANISIVICTGNTSDSSDETALAADAQSLITKPPQQQALNLILSSIAPTPVPQKMEEKEQGLSQFDKILSAMEQKFLPKLLEDSRQISQELVEKQVSKQLGMHIEGLKFSLMDQLYSQHSMESQQAINAAAEEIVNQVLAEQLPQKLQQTIAELNLSQQVAEALATSMQSWLTEQEHTLQQNMIEQLKEQIEQTIVNYLEQPIAAMIAPVIKLQVEKQLAQTGRYDEIDTLANRVSQLNKTIMGLAAIILVLAIFVFI